VVCSKKGGDMKNNPNALWFLNSALLQIKEARDLYLKYLNSKNKNDLHLFKIKSHFHLCYCFIIDGGLMEDKSIISLKILVTKQHLFEKRINNEDEILSLLEFFRKASTRLFFQELNKKATTEDLHKLPNLELKIRELTGHYVDNFPEFISNFINIINQNKFLQEAC